MTPPTDPSDRWRTEWVAALDALEADVSDVERLILDDHRFRDHPLIDPWTPPPGLGPLPLDLVPRADEILSRQLAAAKAVVIAIAVNRRQATAVSRIEVGARGAPRPAFVDQAL
jgi:hypothetical protein